MNYFTLILVRFQSGGQITMVAIVDDSVPAGDAVYCCQLHKEVLSVAICDNMDLAALSIKVLYYCPARGCRSFQCDEGNGMWDRLYIKFGVNTLPYIVPDEEQRVLRHIMRYVFLQAVRIAILTDKIERSLS